ncbi:MAG: LysM peptidoglycan-binding domain-containing protein [Acidimicrobiales bacterium]|nr:LysM peptidoglycan-binding domain-containing protein [Acidimicrobiales bacterium]
MSVENLTIATAVQQFRISRKTLRRLLREGQVVGATTSKEGAEWVFPEASLERLGYARRKSNARSAVAGAAGAATSRSSDSRALRPALIIGVLALVGLVVGVLAIPRGDDGVEAAGDPVWAAIDEVSPAGAVVGVTGSGVAGVVPPDRDAVPIDAPADLDGGPDVVVLGPGAPQAVQDALEADFASTAVDRNGDMLQIYSRVGGDGGEIAAGDPAPGDSDADDADDADGDDADETVGTVAGPVAPDDTAGDPAPDDGDSDGGSTDDGDTDADEPEVDDAEDGNAENAGTDGGEHVVATGDNFWTIAESVVYDADPGASDADVVNYWTTLIDANVDQLVEPGNADLILPGQTLVVPPLTAGT